MARFSRRQFGFTNGEVTPLLHMRADMEFYYAGLSKCVNWIPDTKGNLHRRPPTRFVTESKSGEKPCLYPFNVGRDCPVIVEAYPDCFRFIIKRAQVVDGAGAAYELPHTYGADYCDLEFTQDCGALFIAHENHPKQILRKQDGFFTLEQIDRFPFDALNDDADCKITLEAGAVVDSGGSFFGEQYDLTGANLAFNEQLVLTADDGATTFTVQAFSFQNVGFSQVWVPLTVLPLADGDYDIWDGAQVTGVVNLKRAERAELRGQGCAPFSASMIGQQIRILDEDGTGGNQPNTWITVTVTGFSDEGRVIVAYGGPAIKSTDLFQLPAFSDGVFPETVQIFNDRLWCAKENGTTGSKVGNFFNWEPTDPDGTVNPDNAIYKNINNGECSDIRWLMPMGRQLLVGASDGVYSLLGAGVQGAFQADAVAERDNQSVGVSDVRPIKAGESVFFIDRTRTKLYATGFTQQYEHIGLEEYTLFADHIGDKRIAKIAYQESPYSVIWGITDDGCLFSVTVLPGQNVKGWARHELGGDLIVNGCCKKPEICDITGVYGPDEATDDIFLVVKRTVNGVDRFYIEVIGEYPNTNTHHFEAGYLDCYLPLTNITEGGLSLLGDGGPEAFSAASPVSYSIFDGDDWFKFNVADGMATPVIPNYSGDPVAGRDWVCDDDGNWTQIPKPKYCDEPQFVGSDKIVYRPPCGAIRYASCVESLTGLEHLAGECVMAFVDGQMHEIDVAADGSAQISGCVVRVGFPYDSVFGLLPYRQNLGTTDGAADPSRTFEINANVMGAVWLEGGTGKRDEYHREAAQWSRVEFDDQAAPLNEPEPYTGWVNLTHHMDVNKNGEADVCIRARGPWGCVVRSVETIVEASGGR